MFITTGVTRGIGKRARGEFALFSPYEKPDQIRRARNLRIVYIPSVSVRDTIELVAVYTVIFCS